MTDRRPPRSLRRKPEGQDPVIALLLELGGRFDTFGERLDAVERGLAEDRANYARDRVNFATKDDVRGIGILYAETQSHLRIVLEKADPAATKAD